VVDAPKPVLFVAGVVEAGSSMRAEIADQSHVAVGVTKRYEFLAK
jgi:hypothetical protein